MAFLKKEQTDLAIQDFLLIFAESFKLQNKDEVNINYNNLAGLKRTSESK